MTGNLNMQQTDALRIIAVIALISLHHISHLIADHSCSVTNKIHFASFSH